MSVGFAADPSSPTPTPTGRTPARLRLLGTVIGLTAAAVLFIGYRFDQRGKWLPRPPDQAGAWTGVEMPMARSASLMLGEAPTVGRRYTNPFNERVEAHVIATASFNAYHEPAMLQPGMGFSLTAERRLPLFGKDKPVRALILKSDGDGQRVLMYYWLQYRDGGTSTRGSINDYRDVAPRLTVGAQTILDGQQSVIVRAYTQIHPADALGVQARRNLDEVARAMYESLRKDGAQP